MKTKLTDTVYLEQKEIEKEFRKSWVSFISGNENTRLEESFQKVTDLLSKDRWVVMLEDFVYDNKIKACWLGLCTENFKYDTNYVANGSSVKEIVTNLNKKYKTRIALDLPTKDELLNSLTKINSAPFALSNQRPGIATEYYSYKVRGGTQSYDTDSNYLCDSNANATPLPLIRLTKANNFNLSNRAVFFRWIALGLIPKALQDDKEYNFLIQEYKQFAIELEDFTMIKDIKLKKDTAIVMLKSLIVKRLLNEDKIRADIKPYNAKMLEDTEQGHWSLWGENKDSSNMVKATLNSKLVARDPKSSIVDGTVGIDFGTKSTVVVYQKDTTDILPMRIGTGDLSQNISATHYENPTIMELNNLQEFMDAYNDREGRPYTKWEDLTISHTANNSLLNSKSQDYNSFISELKQWAGNKDKKLKVVDKKGFVLDLPPFLQLSDTDTNPIEIYAYYLGLYINNQHNGIYLNYILSFPVTYELSIRDKIVESFKKGIQKSLPQELHDQEGEVEKLSVIKGASEPAAYAVVALQEYGFAPEGDEKVFYGVFDFGGGTTDFDFGIYREANSKKERRFDFVIEHFGAGGDRYLGGENLLELLAFEIFKNNKEKLLKENIQFVLPPECKDFLGSETLVAISREAKMNTKVLMEKVRPLWEGVKDEAVNYENGILEVTLSDIDAKQHTNFELDIDKEKLLAILEVRIKKGVENFFHSLRRAFDNYTLGLNEIEEINIFLAGNSSKSALVKKLFDAEITRVTQEYNTQTQAEKEIFKIFAPLSGELGRPTGKTGVAFGLIETRKGGDIKVIDHNLKENHEIAFKYYLGESRRKTFKVLVDRQEKFNKWVAFVDAGQDTFELYYSSQSIVSTNKIAINDNSIKKMRLTIDVVDEDALVYIRIVAPDAFEYVVAKEDEIENDIYLGKITKVNIKV